MEERNRERVLALRALATRVRDRAELLPESERVLVQALFDHGNSINGLAKLMGLWPTTLTRRLSRVVGRMTSPKFGFFAARLQRLGPTRGRIARTCILHGLSLRQAARELRVSHHVVRRHAAALHAMFESAKDRKGEA